MRVGVDVRVGVWVLVGCEVAVEDGMGDDVAVGLGMGVDVEAAVMISVGEWRAGDSVAGLVGKGVR